MPIKELWFNYKLECIEVFLNRAFQVRDEYALAAGLCDGEPDFPATSDACVDPEHAVDILIGYDGIVLRAVYHELNALVELELKRLAQSILGANGEVPQRLGRGTIRRVIEQEYGINFRDLPRFEEIDRIRRVANAFKHDDGFGEEYEEVSPGRGFLFGYVQKRYNLDWEKTQQRIEAVKEFMTALPGERESLRETRLKAEDEQVLRARSVVWERIRESGGLGHQLGTPVHESGGRGGVSAVCELCGKTLWAESKDLLGVGAVLDGCPGAPPKRAHE